MAIFNTILSKFKVNDIQSNQVAKQENGSRLGQIYNNTAGTVKKVVCFIPRFAGMFTDTQQENGSRLGQIYNNTAGTVKKVVCFIPRFAGMLTTENITRTISTTAIAASFIAPGYSSILQLVGYLAPTVKDGYDWCKENREELFPTED